MTALAYDTFDDLPALDLTAKITKLDALYSMAGGFGDVYKAHYTSNEGVSEVAVKTFRFNFTVYGHAEKAGKIAKMIRRELGVWRRLCHPKIVPFLGNTYDFERNGTTSLVSEWMSNGTLRDFLARNDDRLAVTQRLQLLSDIANGLFYLHSFPMVHGDLTCTNVLINRELNACLTDFGLTSVLGDLPETLGYLQMTSTRPGAIRYTAPELVNKDVVMQPTTQSDIYSFGNLALLILSGKRPWSEVQRDVAIIIRLNCGDKPNRPQYRQIEDRHWEDLIERCWFPVNQRPRAGDIVASLKVFLGLCVPIQHMLPGGNRIAAQDVVLRNPGHNSDIAQMRAIYPLTGDILDAGQGRVCNRLEPGESLSGPISGYIAAPKMLLNCSLTSFVAEELRRHICTDIPHRFVNTSTMTFVERMDLFDIFSKEIEHISNEIKNQMEPNMDVSAQTPQHMTQVLRETIQDVVKYATLSHCWTNDEPSYRGLTVWKQHESSGFKKLSHFCRTAKLHGYSLAWLDTCCINESDKKEHTEAVQMMSNWCAHSHLCIVYLADSTSCSDFSSDTWFTRSWPLVELLVPRRIKFYNRNWQALTDSANDKDDKIITDKISAVTRIPREVLVTDNRRGVKGRGVWEIMSWASKRKTTRVEDAAYSLCGLFGTTVQISYGEGDHAFHNLLKAIVKGKCSWDIFAWAGIPSQHHPALPSFPSCYPEFDSSMVGRDVGMTDFSITMDGWHLTSVPLIPLDFHSSEPMSSGSTRVTLRPRPTPGLGRYGDLAVICGTLGLRHLRYTEDLHACILNYRSAGKKNEGELKVGKEYVCFLLHSRYWLPEGPTWVKFTTDNQLRISYREMPLRLGSGPQVNTFTFPLENVRIEGRS
ncbi:kinase-like domain-containing protein [Chiua virens]|nr:kinase-like domain-containing protein [Chiua virens]